MNTSSTSKRSFTQKLLDRIEKVGNKLPQPVTLFAILMGVTLLLSFVFGGFEVEHPGKAAGLLGPDGNPVDTISVINLLSRDGFQMIMTRMVSTFALFPPLGLVLVVMLGIGVAEYTGMISVALRLFVSKVPKSVITFSVVLSGMLSSVAADAGYVVLIPMGAAIFYGMGRHPLAGIGAAFAGVSGGFGANLLPTGLDPMIAAFTEPAAQIIAPGYTVNPLSNYYLMAASVPLVALAGTWVTEKILVPRLGPYKPDADLQLEEEKPVSAKESRALLWTAVGILAVLGLVFFTIIPADGLLRGDIDPTTGVRTFKPFYDALAPIMFLVFLLSGLIYGYFAGTIRSDKDVTGMMAKSMGTMGMYIVIAFVAAQFVAYFNWSNLGSVLAVKGSDGLKSLGISGGPLLVAFILVASVVNLVMGSASAKWALLAPIFVPMLMLMGYSPETTQAAYRIGDSYSNILTPLLPYFPLVIVFAQKYVKDVGIGTLISMMLPYAIAFALVRIPMLLLWIWAGLPLGIEGPIFYLP
jgi:aminobenzoyl-glutamate transport protein